MSVNYTTNTLLASCIYDPPNMAAVAVAVALILESQRPEVCVRNELAYETTYWNIEKARHEKIWKCKDCPRGTYGGEPGVCHPCPQFTRQLTDK